MKYVIKHIKTFASKIKQFILDKQISISQVKLASSIFVLFMLILIVVFSVKILSYISKNNALELEKQLMQKQLTSSLIRLSNILHFNLENAEAIKLKKSELILNKNLEAIEKIPDVKVLIYNYRYENEDFYFFLKTESTKNSLLSLLYYLYSVQGLKVITMNIRENNSITADFYCYYAIISNKDQLKKMQDLMIIFPSKQKSDKKTLKDFLIIQHIFPYNGFVKKIIAIKNPSKLKINIQYDTSAYTFVARLLSNNIETIIAKNISSGEIIFIYQENIIDKKDNLLYFTYNNLYYVIKILK